MKKTILQFSTFSLVALLSCFSQINAQSTITIGSGTSSNTNTLYPAPYGNWYWGAKHQILIKSAELTSAGMIAGNISKLAFNVAIPKGVPLTGFTIKMASTGLSALTTTFATTGFSIVFGPQTYTDITGWNTHTFSTPFYWNGTSNIIIETCFANSSYTNNAQMYYSATSYNSVGYMNQDNSGICSSSTGTLSMNRPNIRFTYTPSNTPPTVNFKANKTFSCSGVINFTDSSCCNLTSWLWDFGDGVTSTLQNPSHTYSSSGVYSVSLLGTNSYGSNTLVKNNFISISIGGGPVAASCTSQTTGYCCGFGITNVTFNTINNTTPDALDGFQDYSCLSGTTLYAGVSYPISVSTPQPSPHNVMVWIDYNNNGIFDPVTELAFSSTSTTIATGNISISSSATFNTSLRMRVSADFEGNALPTPCGNLQYGQAEDYSVTILANTNPPVANFTSQPTISCDGFISFSDNSTNIPTSWLWDFGDGATSNANTPSHTYLTSGAFTVTLTSTNTFGSNTIVKNNYVTITLGNTPLTPSCVPPTIGYCCGYGTYKVSLNTINNITANGADGYKDYSCSQQTTLTQGNLYSIFVQTSPTDAQDTRIWVDLNNNGTFGSSELLFSSNNTFNAAGTITTPGGAVLNTPLRMRVFSDYAGSNPNPCSNATYGQVEDYAVTIVPDTNPPVAKFGTNTTNSCNGIITFADSSLKIPISWFWDFGDGTTSTIQNPTHQFTATGTFTITLIATNIYGSDTLTKSNYINIASLAGSPIMASCAPVTLSNTNGYGVFNVALNTINNATTNGGADSYKDYSCLQQTSLVEAINYPVSVKTGLNNNEYVKIWIDYNNDGIFNSTIELAYSDYGLQNHTGTINIPSSALKNIPLRMRVSSDYTAVAPCTNVMYGQVEDYGLTILPNTIPPITAFAASPSSSCNGIRTFTNSTVNATSYSWDFGDGTTSTMQTLSHTYALNGTYTVTLIACNAYGCDTLIKSNYINITLGGPITTACIQNTTSYCCGIGIYNITFNTINNTTADGVDGYKDYSCSQQTTVTVGQAYSISAITGTQYTENVLVWIDYNNDGTFNSINEQVFFDNALQNHNGNITISGNAVLNTPLRLRIASDYNAINICSSLTYGQAEDYAIIIQPNTIPPVVNFNANSTTSCNGIIAFNNSTTNATSFVWNFGDGTTSTLQNPTHTYTNSGVYAVSLIACNPYGCDTLLLQNYISITFGGPISATCSPITSSYCCGRGIFNVTLNSINNTTSSGIDSYKDYSCTQQTSIIAGQNYSVSVQTGTNSSEYLKIWIDYNNDGAFNASTELAFSDYALQNHAGTINIPAAAVLNTPLRMRVASDNYTLTPCTNVTSGQMEDYALTVLPNTQPPVADFTANTTTVNAGGTVSFTDLSANFPSSWQWSFLGGNPTSSTTQNPSVVYNTLGTFPVKLLVTNSFGADSITKTAYIYVVNSVNMCSGTTTTSASSGVLYDSGGPSFDYNNNENCSFLITPTCASSITLNFSDFNTEPGYDYIKIYNGTNSSAPILLSTSGSNIPASVTASSGEMFIIFTSDYSFAYSGFEANWTSVISASINPPLAQFGKIQNNCQNFQFIDSSLNCPSSWLWDFGDGSTSALRNPSHTYANNGTYTISLIVCNGNGCDTLVKTNYVLITSGPIAAFCSPVTTGYCCGIGIYNVTLNAINNTSADGVDGYKDYTCAQQTSVIAGQSYSISVTTDITYSNNVKIWIDYNNDGAFNTSNEQVFVDSALTNHYGTIVFPVNATLNTALRMRVAADFDNVYSCTDVTYGQMEDYSISIQSNTAPPIVNFSANSTSSCDGIISFNNTTSNASSFSWNFGDGASSSAQNPTHSYTANGVYTVMLIACNGYGCDTLILPNYINILLGGPLNAACSPITTSYCCGMGIYNVTFNTINSTSADGYDSYKDYTCTQQTTVNAGQSYSISVTTDIMYSNFVKVWIDYNNDGLFNTSNEQIFYDSAITNHNGTIVIPPTPTFNSPLRMRVAADLDNVFPCTDVTYGQVEDYSILILDKLGINESDGNNNLTVYPNPSNQYININYTFYGAQEFTIYLYNLLGEKMFSEKQTGVSTFKKIVETTNYPTGVYQLRIESEKEKISRMINIIH